jgi:hypothetical protein
MSWQKVGFHGASFFPYPIFVYAGGAGDQRSGGRGAGTSGEKGQPCRWCQPVPLPGFDMLMLWHERLHRDPAHQWLRQHLLDCL